MSSCGIDAPTVRSAIFRLKRRGLLEPIKKGSAAGYALSESAVEILAEGDRRIFARRRATIDDGWLLAMFSVPESERDKRHLLRSRLTWLGFGSVGPGVWIAPAQLVDESRSFLVRSGLDQYVTLFQAHYLGFAELRMKVPEWWDLTTLQELYEQFLELATPLLMANSEGARGDDSKAFSDYLTLLTSWRRLPYLDPGLPLELLPPNWSGLVAADTFFQLHDRLAGPARSYATSVITGGLGPR